MSTEKRVRDGMAMLWHSCSGSSWDYLHKAAPAVGPTLPEDCHADNGWWAMDRHFLQRCRHWWAVCVTVNKPNENHRVTKKKIKWKYRIVQAAPKRSGTQRAPLFLRCALRFLLFRISRPVLQRTQSLDWIPGRVPSATAPNRKKQFELYQKQN